MRRPARIRQSRLVALPCIAVAWWGCAGGSSDTTPGTGGASASSSVGTGGSVGSGGFGVGGNGGTETCTSTSKKAEIVPLDLVFVIDRSGSMSGDKWMGTTSALSTFFNDPASAGISAGMVYFPTVKPFGVGCDEANYLVLDVPIGELPDNAFALTNSMRADPDTIGTPTYPALLGALKAATAFQDAHPKHKVNVVLATDGDPSLCGAESVDQAINNIAGAAKGALDYNGVHTFIIAVEGSNVAHLDKIAAAGGTTAAYDITQAINKFSETMAEIRGEALGCEFEIPPPPNGTVLVPDSVNFTYTPGGADTPLTLPRADDIADCGDQPGWYYNNNAAPTKILLCPASCTTVQNDGNAEVNVAFGCQSVLN